jgi:hypothetical protein
VVNQNYYWLMLLVNSIALSDLLFLVLLCTLVPVRLGTTGCQLMQSQSCSKRTWSGAFVARWCVGTEAEAAGGVLQVREDKPAPRLGAGCT